MEETIGYEALYSPDEWDSLDLVPDEDLDVLFAEVTPDGDGVEASHSCTVYDPPGEQAGNENSFEVECERCGLVGAGDDRTEAEAIARLHETLQATVIHCWPHRCEATDNGSGLQITCPTCGVIGSASSPELGRLVGRLHENVFELAGIAAEKGS